MWQDHACALTEVSHEHPGQADTIAIFTTRIRSRKHLYLISETRRMRIRMGGGLFKLIVHMQQQWWRRPRVDRAGVRSPVLYGPVHPSAGCYLSPSYLCQGRMGLAFPVQLALN